MAQMIRKQIYIDADNERFLKERSHELGITEAEVVRQALAEAERQALADAAEQRRSATRLQAWEDMKNFIRIHRMSDIPQTEPQSGWKFNREEMYDEVYEERFERHRRRRENAAERTEEPSNA